MIENTENNRAFTPAYPWVFVRVLQREQKIGSIYVVDGPKQNKPMHEGVVLVTWQPCRRAMKGKLVDVSCDLKPGDHVLFHHWSGLPVVGYNDQHYRIIKERDWQQDKEGGIVGLVDYDTSPEVELYAMLASIMEEEKTAHAIAEAMVKRFLIVDREKPSVTLSGL